MPHRPKLTWLAFVGVALVAEGVAVAQPSPAPAGGSSPPAATGSAGTQPPAAPRPGSTATSATSGPKKGSADPVVDWTRMASRLPGGASSSNAGLLPPDAGGTIATRPGSGTLQGLHGSTSTPGATTAGQASQVAPPPLADPAAVPSNSPDLVVKNQIMPAARTCYANDPSSQTHAPGRLALLIKVSATGTIDSVTVGINAGVAPSLVSCITAAARAAKFVAPGDAGATVPATFIFPLRPQG